MRDLNAILNQHTNRRGLALVSQPRLLRETGLDLYGLQAGLASLEESHVIEILSPLPFLVARVRMWSSKTSNHEQLKPRSSGSGLSVHIEVPVSSSFAAAAFHKEVGGVGEGDSLLGEALAVLGSEAVPGEIRTILAQYSPTLVRRCLRRVEATAHIRVSKTALFRSLLIKLSQ